VRPRMESLMLPVSHSSLPPSSDLATCSRSQRVPQESTRPRTAAPHVRAVVRDLDVTAGSDRTPPPEPDEDRTASAHPRRRLTEASREEFARAPVGRFVRGHSYVVWVADPTLLGAVYHGVPSVADVREFVPLLDISNHPHMQTPIDMFTDARRVRGLDDSAYRVLVSSVRQRLPDLARNIRRHAVVHPPADGIVGIAIAGLHRVLGPKFATNDFVSVADAFAWLERGADDGIVTEVTELTAETVAGPVSMLRMLLGRRPESTLSEAAARLGVSERSLQRALRAAHSTFRQEATEARMKRAANVLAESSDKREAIASRLGLSRSSLSRTVRRLTDRPKSTREDDR